MRFRDINEQHDRNAETSYWTAALYARYQVGPTRLQQSVVEFSLLIAILWNLGLGDYD